MSYYLQHYFDPDMDHTQLKPKASQDKVGKSDLYNLGYVQNVVSGQVLAQILPLADVKNPDPRFIVDEPKIPGGVNTRVDPKHPEYLLADSNGYVFYLADRITVKKLLNVRGDVAFNTGNVYFIGDCAVHGNVRAGFSVQASNLLIKGMVEGGVVRAGKDLSVAGGARGGAGGHCLLTAGGKMRLSFAEKVEVRSSGNMLIEKYCLNSGVYVGGNLVVHGRLQGGSVNAYKIVYVAEQLGNVAATPTRIFLGYDPALIKKLEKVDKEVGDLSEKIAHYKAVAGHLPPGSTPTSRKLHACLDKRDHLLGRRRSISAIMGVDEKNIAQCRLVVKGRIYPGVEVSIGRVNYDVTQMMNNVMFSCVDDEIIVTDASKIGFTS